MIAKPTTEQILLDCCRELTEVVLPAVQDETVKVSVMMLDLVLRNAAVRAAHEIAWMTDEIEELRAYVREVAEQHPDAITVADGPDDVVGTTPRSLQLDDMVEDYREASEAFSVAMEAATAAGDERLVGRAAAILERRADREVEVMSGWSPVGR